MGKWIFRTFVGVWAAALFFVAVGLPGMQENLAKARTEPVTELERILGPRKARELQATIEKMQRDPLGAKADNCQWRESNTSAADAKLCWIELEAQVRRRR